MPSGKKLTRNSKAVSLLRKLLASGELSGNENPKTVWESNPLFHCHKLTNFRSCYNRYRKEYSDANDNDLNQRCTNSDVERPSKKRRLIDMEAESVGSVSYQSVEKVDQKGFQPLYLLANWSEPKTTTKRVSVAILLPTGVEDFSVRVTEDGLTFEICVTWPRVLLNVEILHRKWIHSKKSDQMQPYHPKLVAFEEALKDLRSKATEQVTSVAKIALPFKVETHIHQKFNLCWRDSSSRIVYVDLRAAMDTYGLLSDKQEFEEC